MCRFKPCSSGGTRELREGPERLNICRRKYPLAKQRKGWPGIGRSQGGLLSTQRCTSARLWHHRQMTCFQQFRHSSIFLNSFLYNSYHKLHQHRIALKLNYTCVTPVRHQHTLLHTSKVQDDGFLEIIAQQKCSCAVHSSHPTHRSCPPWKQHKTFGDTSWDWWCGGTTLGAGRGSLSTNSLPD